MRLLLLTILNIFLFIACGNNETKNKKNIVQKPIELTLEQANRLVELPLICVQKEYPFMLTHTLNDKSDAKEPTKLYPAFCGCFDWHSAVHGHWSLVKLLKEFPELEKADSIKIILRNNLSKENIIAETDYFKEEKNKHFERTYGWAWLLKLAEELHTWDSPLSRELEDNLSPLTTQIEQMFIDFLPKLKHPVRVGEHPNTAFGLSFALDYAKAMDNNELKNLISTKAKEFYLEDKGCPLDWEPGGYDFLSPCFEELDLMRKVLSKEEFDVWLNEFMPQIMNPEFKIEVAEVSDRTDGKLVHLDGLNFSRAWVLYGLAKQDTTYNYLINVANEHINYSLPNIFSDSYEGGHWLGTFALYALAN